MPIGSHKLDLLSETLRPQWRSPDEIKDPLQRALAKGDWASITQMIENDETLAQKKFWRGRTLLMIMTARGQKEIVSLLLEKGADISAKTDDGDTVLMSAAGCRNEEMTGYFLEKGVPINEKGDRGRTALMVAVSMGTKKAVEILLENGAEVNEKNDDGETALMLAVAAGNKKEVIELLLKSGASTLEKNKHRATILEIAGRNSSLSPEVLALLEAHQKEDALEATDFSKGMGCATRVTQPLKIPKMKP